MPCAVPAMRYDNARCEPCSANDPRGGLRWRSHPSCFSETRLSSITGSTSCASHVKKTGPKSTAKSRPAGEAAVVATAGK